MSAPSKAAKRTGAGMSAAAAILYVVLGLVANYQEMKIDRIQPIRVFLTAVTFLGAVMAMATIRPGSERKEMYMMAGVLAGSFLMVYALFALVDPKQKGDTIHYWLVLAGVPAAVLATVVSARLGPIPITEDKKLNESSRRNANHVAPCNWCHWVPAWRARY